MASRHLCTISPPRQRDAEDLNSGRIFPSCRKYSPLKSEKNFGQCRTLQVTSLYNCLIRVAQLSRPFLRVRISRWNSKGHQKKKRKTNRGIYLFNFFFVVFYRRFRGCKSLPIAARLFPRIPCYIFTSYHVNQLTSAPYSGHNGSCARYVLIIVHTLATDPNYLMS
jgi:hypothetical protein